VTIEVLRDSGYCAANHQQAREDNPDQGVLRQKGNRETHKRDVIVSQQCGINEV
jgi:hypothetical protein